MPGRLLDTASWALVQEEMTCPRCHTSNPDDASSCTSCGAAFDPLDDDNAKVGKRREPSAASPVAPLPSVPPDGADSPTLDGDRVIVRKRGESPAVSPAAGKTAATGILSPPPSSGLGSSPPGASGPRTAFSLGLEPGAELGARYRIEARLGEGGMGIVYKAYDKELDRLVALKLVRPDLTANPEVMQRFKQELLLASRISHKNILRIHDLGEVAGVKFITMAYVDGHDLSHLLKKEGRMPVDRAVKVARQLCDGLGAAHAEGVVHRDLKPQNILLDKAGVPYISDFGLAKSLEGGAAAMTRTGQLLGTPRYMSPEQVESDSVDHRSDLYSLGLILYEMLTGDVPFKGGSTLQLMYQRVKEKPSNPKLLNPDLPDYLVRIIMRCLEKDPARRYQHAGEILADLDAQRSPSRSLGVQITVPKLTRLSWKWWMAGAGALILLALVAFPVRNLMLRRRSPAQGPSTSMVAPSQARYVAVLPFRVLGDQTSLGYISEGLVEALSAKLFQLKDLRVASAAAVEKANTQQSLDKIAKDLGVSLILQGTLQGTKDNLRIALNLEDVAAGRRLWTQEFSAVPQDLLTLEDQIYAKLVDALELKPGNEELAGGAMHPTENVEAYDLYLRGRNAIHGGRDPSKIQAAIGYYENALKKDPQFALAYAGLADATLQMYQLKKESSWADKALAAAQQARRLNENLAEVHFSLGNVYNATGKTAAAAAELKHALELAPNSDEGYRRLGDTYLASNRYEEAIRACQKAIEINPYFWVNHSSLGTIYFQMGEYDKALSAFRKVTELEPDNAFGYLNVGSVYLQQGKYQASIPTFQKSLQLQPYALTYSNLGTAYFYLKRYDEAAKLYDKAIELNPSDELTMGNLADAYRWMGEKEKSLATYDQAIALAYKELQVNTRNADTLGGLALYYAKKGEAAHAATFIRRARSIDRANVTLIYTEAVVEVLAGRPKEALQALGEAFRKGYPMEVAKNDPELGGLQARPEFEQLMKQLGAKPH
jgi:serine/threonine-protein kinase